MSIDKNLPVAPDYLTPVQFALIILPFAFFFDTAVHFRGRINLSVPIIVILLMLLNGGVLFFSILAVIRYIAFRKKSMLNTCANPTAGENRFLSYLPVLVVISIFTVLALFQFNNIPRYDGGLYYNALITKTNSFSFSTLVTSFSLFDHPTQGISLFLASGEMLFPKQSVGVYGVTLILTILALLCLYQIMGRIFRIQSSWIRAAGVAVFAFCPYILGLFSYPTPDYYVTIFFVFLIWCFAVNLDYLAGFSSVLLIFSKETGILFAASFLLAAMFLRIQKNPGKNFFYKAKKYIFPKKIFIYGAAPVLFILYYKFAGDFNFYAASTHISPLRWDSSSWHCFGLNLPYISVRLSQLLLYNFFWVISLMGFLTALIYLGRHRKRLEKAVPETAGQPAAAAGELSDSSLLAGILVSSTVYLIFTCLFITHLCPRYSVCFALPLSLISVSAVTYLFRSRIAAGIILSALAMLFLAQTYCNLDPLIAYDNPRIFTGKQYIYSPTAPWYTERFQLSFLDEMYVYNRTYAFTDDLLDCALAKINLSKSDHILTAGCDYYELYLFRDTTMTGNLIYWDPVNLRRTYDSAAEGAFVPDFLFYKDEDILDGSEIALSDDFYYILPARRTSDYLEAIERRGYTVKDSFKVENYIGYLNVYHLVRSS